MTCYCWHLQGIVAPINPSGAVVGRSRLGFGGESKTDMKSFKSVVTAVLKKFVDEDLVDANTSHQMVFSEKLTNEERALVHNVASRFGLSTKSFDCDDGSRRLAVWKEYKGQSAGQLLMSILDRGGDDIKYIVIPPTSIHSSGTTVCDFMC